MKRGLLALCLVVSLSPVSALAAAPSFEQALDSVLTEGKPSSFNGTVTLKSADSDLMMKVRGAGENGKIPKAWATIDVKGKTQGQVIDLSVELRFKNNETYIRVDDARPDFFFSHWEGVKGKWYVLPQPITLNQVKDMLSVPTSQDAAAELASMFETMVTRFKSGYSFSFSSPSLSGKIDTALDNGYRFASGMYSLSDGDMMLNADFKMQRQFVSVYVETPKGSLKSFPIFSEEQHALLNGMGGNAISGLLWQQGEEPQMTMPLVSVSEPERTESMTQSSEPTEVQTVTMPGMTVTVRSRAVRNDGRELLNLLGEKEQNVKLQVRVVTNPNAWASVVNAATDYSEGRGVLYMYKTPATPAYSTEGLDRSLDVMFFDRYGSFISSATMPRCVRGGCPSVMPLSPATYALETQEGFIRKNKIGKLWRVSLERAALSPVIHTTERSVSDREALRRRHNLNQATDVIKLSWSSSTDNEQLMTLATSLSSKLRGADVSTVIASGTAATVPMRNLYSLLKDAELSNPGVTYVYVVAPTGGMNTFKLLVDNFTLLSAALLDLNKNGKIDVDEKPAVPGTIYSNSLYTQALKAPTIDYSNGETTAYVPVRDGAGNVLAVLAVTESTR